MAQDCKMSVNTVSGGSYLTCQQHGKVKFFSADHYKNSMFFNAAIEHYSKLHKETDGGY